MDNAQAAAIEQIIKPIVSESRIELVELTCRAHAGKLLIRLLVDKPGGVTIAQCARVNQRVSQALDEANLISESYTVEVSSPGLDRPLVSKRDFERALGEMICLELASEDGRFRDMDGVVLAVQD